jgi:hypothetical protein
MLTELNQIFPIQPIVDQVKGLTLNKRHDLNQPTGKFFNDPWQTKDEFINTPLGDVLASIPNVGQARLLTLDSAESYTAHTDPDDRYHLAIITNPMSYLIDLTTKTLHHVHADGKVIVMDTGRTHVASNWGGTPRIHLNVRVLLPHFNPGKQGIHLTVIDGPIDWKQASYIELMGTVNRLVKSGDITGFEAPNERELYLNCNPRLIQSVIDRIRLRGVELFCETF